MNIKFQTSAPIDELYKKFGLIDGRFNLEEQMKAIVSFNNMLTEDILNEVYNKYDVPECREFAELKRKAPKAKFRTAFMPRAAKAKANTRAKPM